MSRVFPMFTALGEMAWAEGWDPQMLSGKEERGSVFVTQGHNGRAVTWIVIDYRPAAGKVSYARVAEESNIGLVDVACRERTPGVTEVTVRYTLTALNDSAQPFVDRLLQNDHYTTMIEGWRMAINRALGLPTP
jgi:hypothetical protein